MKWAQWEPTYREILTEFGWDESDDVAAAEQLQGLLPRNNWRQVGTELKHRPLATVVGCGPSLESATAADMQGIIVAADGATSRLRELGVVPRVVVTDLDGKWEDLVWAAEQGASMVVHAHGHNIPRLAWIADLGPFVAGTCQSNPHGLEPVQNHGGFTDGDRAVLLCEAYGVKEIKLVGFDMESAPSKYSHEFDAATKSRKLAWAKRILADAGTRVPIRGL